MRRFGERPEPGRQYTPRPGAYGVILNGDQALIAMTENPTEGVLLPGGGVDPGESPVQALHRETMEETGWRIQVKRRIGAYRRFVYMPDYDLWAEKICHIYLCRAGRRVAEPIEPDHTPVWMTIDDAAALLSLEGERALFSDALRISGARKPVF